MRTSTPTPDVDVDVGRRRSDAVRVSFDPAASASAQVPSSPRSRLSFGRQGASTTMLPKDEVEMEEKMRGDLDLDLDDAELEDEDGDDGDEKVDRGAVEDVMASSLPRVSFTSSLGSGSGGQRSRSRWGLGLRLGSRSRGVGK